jgi:hypothetical protein
MARRSKSGVTDRALIFGDDGVKGLLPLLGVASSSLVVPAVFSRTYALCPSDSLHTRCHLRSALIR